MTRRTETLRLAVGLAHAVPGADLLLRCNDGHRLLVGSENSADIHICDLRRVMIASACPTHPNPADWVEALDLEGSLHSQGGGIYRVVRSGREERWFASALRPEVAFARLGQLDAQPLPTSAFEVSLKPDPGLRLTSVCVRADELNLERHLDELALAAHAACLVEEILADTTPSVNIVPSLRTRRRNERPGERSDLWPEPPNR